MDRLFKRPHRAHLDRKALKARLRRRGLLVPESTEARRAALYAPEERAAEETPAPPCAQSLFQCPQCESRDVEYAQAQTRGADEAMTVFFLCVACDHRWKEG